MTDFALGFQIVGRICLRVGGGIAAVLLYCFAMLLVLLLAGAVFDRITQAMARHWEKKGRQPRNRLGCIILDNYRRDRGKV